MCPLSSLSRAASLLSTVGWQGRRDFFFSPFSFTPPTPFWEAVSSATGSCQSKGHQAKEVCWPLGTTCLPPPRLYSQAISLEQGLIIIQLPQRHRGSRRNQATQSKVDRKMLTECLPDLNRARLVCL